MTIKKLVTARAKLAAWLRNAYSKSRQSTKGIWRALFAVERTNCTHPTPNQPERPLHLFDMKVSGLVPRALIITRNARMTLTALAGLGLVAWGIGLIYFPAALITVGVLLIVAVEARQP